MQSDSPKACRLESAKCIPAATRNETRDTSADSNMCLGPSSAHSAHLSGTTENKRTAPYNGWQSAATDAAARRSLRVTSLTDQRPE